MHLLTCICLASINLNLFAMSSYRQLFYHILFRTKDSEPTINPENDQYLYAYITGIITNKEGHLYRINGVDDHLHICTDIHASFAVADIVRDIKSNSSSWMKESGLFPKFKGWSEGYGAFTVSYRNIGTLIEYIKSQKVHHGMVSFEDEYRELLREEGVDIDERFFP